MLKKINPTKPVKASELNPCNSLENTINAHIPQNEANNAKKSANMGILIINNI